MKTLRNVCAGWLLLSAAIVCGAQTPSTVPVPVQQTAPAAAPPIAAPPIAAPPGSTAAASEKPSATVDPEKWAQLDKYRDANAKLPANGPGRVVFFGDSITAGWSTKGAFFPGKPYVNRGISGQTTAQMVVRLQQDVLDLHPAAVVVLAGTNDIAQNQGPVTLESIEDNLRTMTERATAAGVRVILASVLPAGDFPWRKGLQPAPKIQQLNAWMKTFCAERKIAYVDYYSAMADEDGAMKPGLSSDGVHPTKDGYDIMGPLAEAAIEAVPAPTQ